MAQMTTLFGRGLEEARRSYRLESGGIHRCAVRDALLAFLRVVREPSMEMRGAAVNADLPAYGGEGLGSDEDEALRRRFNLEAVSNR